MQYPQLFFRLQLAFAKKLAEVSPQSYQDAVLLNTAMYRILGLDWSLDPGHPIWQAYLQGLREKDTDDDWTHQYYLMRYDQIPKYNTPCWGCFSYEYRPDSQVIHFHFANLDASGYGPLSHLRKEARLAELWSMFRHIKRTHPDAAFVRGNSWLYNRKAYTRLFPVTYGQSAKADRPHLIARALWGQFLHHDGQINEDTASLFLQRVSQLQEVQQYPQCFPYHVLLTEAPIGLFYDFYGI